MSIAYWIPAYAGMTKWGAIVATHLSPTSIVIPTKVGIQTEYLSHLHSPALAGIQS